MSTSTTNSRVNYREGQILSAADLVDEQVTRIVRRRRHNIGHHGWGIVTGLQIICDSVDGLVIEPGSAIDGYGRPLALHDSYHVTSGELRDLVGSQPEQSRTVARLDDLNVATSSDGNVQAAERNSQRLQFDFWAVWQERRVTHSGRERILEETVIRCTPASDMTPFRTDFVPQDDHNFTADRVTFPRTSDDEGIWPVFLGRIAVDVDQLAVDAGPAGNNPAGGPVACVPLPVRPTATLNAEAIESISGGFRIEISGEGSANRTRFVVQEQTAGGMRDRLVIHRDGRTELSGPVVIADVPDPDKPPQSPQQGNDPEQETQPGRVPSKQALRTVSLGGIPEHLSPIDVRTFDGLLDVLNSNSSVVRRLLEEFTQAVPSEFGELKAQIGSALDELQKIQSVQGLNNLLDHLARGFREVNLAVGGEAAQLADALLAEAIESDDGIAGPERKISANVQKITALIRSGLRKIFDLKTAGQVVNAWLNAQQTMSGAVSRLILHACLPDHLEPVRLVGGGAAVFTRTIAHPTAAQPWCLYRTTADPESDSERPAQLRLEMHDPGDEGDAQRNLFVIGGWRSPGEKQPVANDNVDAAKSASGLFRPVLSVRADKTVQIHGGLNVTGQLVTGPVGPDSSDPRYQQALLEHWIRGKSLTRAALLANRIDVRVTLQVDANGTVTSKIRLSNSTEEDMTRIQLFYMYRVGTDAGEFKDDVDLVSTELKAGAVLEVNDVPPHAAVPPGETLELTIIVVGARGPQRDPVIGRGVAKRDF